MRFAFIRRHTVEFPVDVMCAVLEVSTSGYYAWLHRPESLRSRDDRRLLLEIRAIHRQSRRRYGSPRLHRELRHRGYACGRHRVARLMRQDGLEGTYRRKFRVTTDSKHRWPVAANRLQRQFKVSRPDTVWAGDITYIRTREGWLYLAVLLDLCSRRVVGWAISSRLTRRLPQAALEMAIGRRRPRAPILHHSDRGSQPGFKRSSQQWLTSYPSQTCCIGSSLYKTVVVGAVRNCGKPVRGFSKGLWESPSDFHMPGSFHSRAASGVRRGGDVPASSTPHTVGTR